MPTLSTAYLPCVQWFCAMLPAPRATIEQHEHYAKQTYRSRCHILGAGGVQALSVPVVKNHGHKMKIRDVQIDYSERWQQQHWRALTAAYNNSPFFAHYADDLRPLYERRERFLFDLNCTLLEQIIKWLELSVAITYSVDYQRVTTDDYRYSISPKCSAAQAGGGFQPQPYYQVFGERFGFTPNLSIVDLLFNEGNGAMEILRRSVNLTLPHL
jgi:hypothetical protein